MDQYIAKTYTGLEAILEAELKNIGASDLKRQNRGVAFSGTPRIMYRANLESRTALKILSEIASFSIDEAQDLYARSMEIEWEKIIPEGKTFAIDTDVYSPFFENTMYAALVCKDAIVDRIRNIRGERPTVDKKTPEIEITLYIRDKSVTIYLNSSGQSLHIRGYKKYPGIAPLSEALAAGLIQLTGWDGKSPFLNPMCGSGSLLIEAQKIARNIPSQIHREDFSFQHWPNYDEERWELIVKGAKMRVNRSNPEIIGFDYNDDAVQGAKKNARTAGSFRSIQIYNHDFFKYEPPLEKATVILNPPYNVRLQIDDQRRFYNQINNMLYRHYKAYDNWIICPSEINLKKAGFRIEKEYTVYNGPIECQFVKLSFESKREGNSPESFNKERRSERSTGRDDKNSTGKKWTSDRKGNSRGQTSPGKKWTTERPKDPGRQGGPGGKWSSNKTKGSGNQGDFSKKWGLDKPKGTGTEKSPGRKWNPDKPKGPRGEGGSGRKWSPDKPKGQRKEGVYERKWSPDKPKGQRKDGSFEKRWDSDKPKDSRDDGGSGRKRSTDKPQSPRKEGGPGRKRSTDKPKDTGIKRRPRN